MTNTEKAIRAAFPGSINKGLRAKLREAARQGPDAVRAVAHTVALTSVGVAKLEGVAVAVARETSAVAPTLHERIAAALGWTLHDAQSFSLQTLREVVRPVSPKLAAELDEAIRSGRYITGA